MRRDRRLFVPVCFQVDSTLLLQHAVEVLQDDTGIPVSYFNQDKWQLRPFGRYTGPISMFARNYQPRLTQLFQTSRPEALDFGLGYQWRVLGSNLLLATRIDANAPDAIASNQPAIDWSPQARAGSIASTGSDDAGAQPKKSANRTSARNQRARAPAPFYWPFFRF